MRSASRSSVTTDSRVGGAASDLAGGASAEGDTAELPGGTGEDGGAPLTVGAVVADS